MTESRSKGTYTLLVGLDRDIEIEVGALGMREFTRGYYAYTGSALGSGGFSRIDRHHRVAAGDHDVRHWHIDYLLGHSGTRLVDMWTSADIDVECAVARSLSGEPIPDFGASDCMCDSHLTYAAKRATLARAIERAHANR